MDKKTFIVQISVILAVVACFLVMADCAKSTAGSLREECESSGGAWEYKSPFWGCRWNKKTVPEPSK